jgi:ubiquinone/menaquinone biosynthesis C-methylase UbiE
MSLSMKYDAINTVIFLPAGGSQRVRQRFVSALEVSPGHRVLELGCGTGQVTALLLAAGAEVVAIDPLAAMLEGARRRARGATIIEGDLFDTEIPGPFDRVVLSFVLHNFDANGRTEALRLSARALAPGGQVGILDWAVPPGRARATLWRRFLTRLEPSSEAAEVTDADLERKHLGGEAPNVSAILDGALHTDVRAAGLEVRSRLAVANGRAQVLIAHPHDDVGRTSLRNTP